MDYRVLGPLEVRDGDVSLPLASAKQRGMLAFLLVQANHVVSRDRLIDALWGDEPPETAVQSVHVLVSRLRKLLPPKTLLTRPPGYLLEIDPDALDLHRFERLFAEGRELLAGGDAERASAVLRQELELWRGPALAEFASELFAQAEIGRLEDLRVLAVEERVDADLALGRHAELTGELEALIAEHPHRERLRGQLMLALYRSGRQTEALEAYRDARRALVDELGIEPGAALQQLEKQILLHDEALDAAPRLSPTNLPLPTGPLLGRETELARIDELLTGGSRLVTLTGPGGSGKTRLALQAAADLADQFADGVFFVALAPLPDARAVPGAAAQALGLRPDDDLHAYLASRRLLLVLDNAEHLVGVEQIVANMLVGEVVALVTSRSPLHLSAELELAVEPLSDDAAAELFSLRAAAVGRSVAPDAIVIELCRRLDNLPLAVELAAARAKLLLPSAILERLEQALPFLTGGPRDAPERQQTLRATIEWSHDLLSDAERVALRRLAVFRGGFSLDAADAVAGADLDLVAALVDKSLLKPIRQARFLMLETLREFALERLEDAGERDEVALRHARFFAERLEMEPDLRGPRRSEFLAWFDAEADNTWAALDQLRASGNEDGAFTLGVHLVPYWINRGRIKQGVAWLEAALADSRTTTAARGRALGHLGELFVHLFRPQDAERALRDSVAVAEVVGDQRGRAFALLNLAWLDFRAGRFVSAVELGRAAREQAAAVGDATLLWRIDGGLAGFLSETEDGLDEAQRLLEIAVADLRVADDEISLAFTLVSLSNLEIARGENAAARRAAEAGLESAQRLAIQGLVANALVVLGFLDQLEHDRAGALRRYVPALETAIESESEHLVFWALNGVAFAAAGFDPCASARIIGAWEATRAAHGYRLTRVDEVAYQQWFQELRQLAGDEAVERELAIGAGLTPDEAIELAFDLARRAGANLKSSNDSIT